MLRQEETLGRVNGSIKDSNLLRQIRSGGEKHLGGQMGGSLRSEKKEKRPNRGRTRKEGGTAVIDSRSNTRNIYQGIRVRGAKTVNDQKSEKG